MRFIRRPEAPLPDSSEQLVHRTALGLAAMTLVLVAALLGAVGFVTAAFAVRATEATVDQNLRDAAAVQLAALQPAETESDGSPAEEDEAQPTEGGQAGDGDDHAPESSDTFFLVLDPVGGLIANPQRVALEGLPDQTAVAAAVAGGEDWRTVNAGGTRVRLLSQRVTDERGGVHAILQSGFVLTLHDEQTGQIVLAIVVTGLVGLVGAAFITLLITRRALAPIRTAFAAERRFVAAASHELRTPVAVVRASAEILQREALVKPKGRQLVDDIVAESDRLARLVGDLLALASAEAGAISVERRAIEMRSFVAELARRTQGMANARGVHIDVMQHGPPTDRELVVSADPDRVTQLLMILLDNAIDHSPPGGTVRLIVTPAVESGRALVTVGVVDQGPGVPPEDRSLIFEPFARLSGRRRGTTNAGLGLAIARILASRQDASLNVGDATGGGAIFSVSLPRRPDEGPVTSSA